MSCEIEQGIRKFDTNRNICRSFEALFKKKTRYSLFMMIPILYIKEKYYTVNDITFSSM